jgi:hypothetical protein
MMTKTTKDTDPLVQSAGETFTYLREYLQLQLDYFRLDLAERTAKAASALVAFLAIGALVLLALFMVTVALALLLGQMWGSYALGFAAIAGLYLLLVLFLSVFKDRILTNPLLSQLLQAFLHRDTKSDDHDATHP